MSFPLDFYSAYWTTVLCLKPLHNAWIVELMKTCQSQNLVSILVITQTHNALLLRFSRIIWQFWHLEFALRKLIQNIHVQWGCFWTQNFIKVTEWRPSHIRGHTIKVSHWISHLHTWEIIPHWHPWEGWHELLLPKIYIKLGYHRIHH